MKKVSTATMKQSGNISQQKLTIGLDLGDRNNWYCVLDEAGQIDGSSECVRVGKHCRKPSAGCRQSDRAGIGTHSPWISRLLSE